VSIGTRTFDFGAGESLLITADVPTISEITQASAAAPYLSIVFDLDMSLIEELALDMNADPPVAGESVRVDPTEAEVADAALRLIRLLDRPASIPVLQRQLLRELHYWLLAGRHGGAIRRLGITDSHAHRIARVVAMIRADYAQPLCVAQLAETAGMSPSSFYEHFKAYTSLTPLQLQKQLRLIEARRMLVSHGRAIVHAAHDVGYESVSQFTREYSRMFGLPPARDVRRFKERLEAT
jgi:AraC-like DNA-binding protein